MKTNYQKADKVTITKIGHFQGLQGEVLSSNEVGAKVLIDGTGLDWFFTFNEIQGVDKKAKLNDEYANNPEVKKVVNHIVSSIEKAKRKYQKRDKNQPEKPKRKYTRKIK